MDLVGGQDLRTMELGARALLQLALFSCSAFFSSSETALFAVTKVELKELNYRKDSRSPILDALLEKPRQLIIGILCGNELVNVAASANMVAILLLAFGAETAGWINIVIMVPLLLLLGEVTPKTIALSNPLKYSLAIVIKPLTFWLHIVSPLSWIVRKASEKITTALIGEETARENILQVDEFRTLLETVTADGEITSESSNLLERLLNADFTEALEVMIPRTQVVFLDADNGLEKVAADFLKLNKYRVPVYRTNRDNLLGFLHLEDFILLDIDNLSSQVVTLEELLEPPMIVPSTKKVGELLDYFQINNIRAAAVLNEFGGIDGIIYLEDILAHIFGHDTLALRPQKIKGVTKKEEGFVVPGDMKLIDFNDLTNYGISDSRMTTIGGVVLRNLDKQPSIGDSVRISGVELRVTNMDGIRISEVEAARIVEVAETLDARRLV